MTPQTVIPVAHTDTTAQEMLTILEKQRESFEMILAITARIREGFEQSGSALLAEGLRERAGALERIQAYAKRLKVLTSHWKAVSGSTRTEEEARIQSLMEECQELISRIVLLDGELSAAARARKEGIGADLARIQQSRRPLAAYLSTPSAPAAVPVSIGRNVHFTNA